jgi:riboflavin synthase
VFTGIVEELGTVVGLEQTGGGITALEVGCSAVIADARVGDSISVDGCCLTVTSFGAGAGGRTGFRTELMGETLARTALGALAVGDRVNLEPALRAEARLGGHLVQGHVDAVATLTAVDAAADPADPGDGEGAAWTVLTFSLPPSVARYVVEKGSITVQGTSLTVMAVADDSFSVGLIPHTLRATVLGLLAPGDRVNLEVDVIAKYVERLLRGGTATPYIEDQS